MAQVKKTPTVKKDTPAPKKKAGRPKKEKSQGICIIAHGHAYYGEMAANLAMSIKFAAPTAKIAFIGNATQHLSPDKRRFFDQFIDIPDKYVMSNGRQSILKAKLHITDLTPFEETILLDADQVAFPKRPVTELFGQKDDFVIQCRGLVDLAQKSFPERAGIWADLAQIKDAYDIKKGHYYNVSTEFIYLKKTEKVISLFEEAQFLFDNLRINHTVFAGGVPDELPLSIAMINEGFKLKNPQFKPGYWEQEQRKRMAARQMHQEFYFYSMGGHMQETHVKNHYNDLVRYYAKHFHIMHPWLHKDKRGWAHSRGNL